MVNVNLRPVAKHQEGMLSYIDINFRRLADSLAALTNAEQGIIAVTGSIQIDTGMAEVLNAFVSFSANPTADAALVSAFPVGVSAPRVIEIRVFKSDFSASTTPVNIAWYALGV